MYERVIEAFPEALLEDGHELPEARALLDGERGRISYDAPIHSLEDLDAQPLPPRALNIKPCRVGALRTLLDLYAETEERGLIVYGGGMGELDEEIRRYSRTDPCGARLGLRRPGRAGPFSGTS